MEPFSVTSIPFFRYSGFIQCLLCHLTRSATPTRTTIWHLPGQPFLSRSILFSLLSSSILLHLYHYVCIYLRGFLIKSLFVNTSKWIFIPERKYFTCDFFSRIFTLSLHCLLLFNPVFLVYYQVISSLTLTK